MGTSVQKLKAHTVVLQKASQLFTAELHEHMMPIQVGSWLCFHGQLPSSFSRGSAFIVQHIV